MSLTLRCAWTFRQISPKDRALQCTGCGRHYLAAFASHCICADCTSNSLVEVASELIPPAVPEPAQVREPLPQHISNRINSISDRPLGISEDVLIFENGGSCLVSVRHNIEFRKSSPSPDSGNTLSLPISAGPLWLALLPAEGITYSQNTIELTAGQQAEYRLIMHFYRPPQALGFVEFHKSSGIQVLACRSSLPIHALQAVAWYFLGLHLLAVWQMLSRGESSVFAANTLAALAAWTVLLTPQILLRSMLLLKLGHPHQWLARWLYLTVPWHSACSRALLAAFVWLVAKIGLAVLWKAPNLLQGPTGEPMAITATAVLAVVATLYWQSRCGINWLMVFPRLFKLPGRRPKTAKKTATVEQTAKQT